MHDKECQQVLIISDVHANAVALEAVLDDASDQFDAVWCLGDLVGYGPAPNHCVARIKGWFVCWATTTKLHWEMLT